MAVLHSKQDIGNHNSKSKQNPVRRAGGQVDTHWVNSLPQHVMDCARLWCASVEPCLLRLCARGVFERAQRLQAVPPRLDFFFYVQFTHSDKNGHRAIN